MAGSVNYCRNNCGVQIRFDASHKSQSGKMIPLEANTGLPHQCPNSDYNRQQKGQITTPINPPPTTNYANIYSGNELAKETRSPKQYEGVDNNNDNTDLEELLRDANQINRELSETLADIRMLIASILHPNPEIVKASNIKKDPDLGLSDDSDNGELASIDNDDEEIVT